MNSPTNQPASRLLAICCSLSAGLGAFLVLWWMVFALEKAEVQRGVDAILGAAAEIMSQRNAVFKELKDMPDAGCTDPMLSSLRTKLISRRQIWDAVVFSPTTNTIICSAVAGRLATPQIITAGHNISPKYPGRKTWLKIRLSFLPTDQDYHLVREGDLGLVLFPQSLQGIVKDLRWSMYTADEHRQFVEHNYGDASLYPEFVGSQAMPFNAAPSVKSCISSSGSVCVIGKRSFAEVWQRNLLVCTLGLLFSASVAVAVFYLASELSRARSSAKGRVMRSLASRRYENFRCVYQPIVDLRDERIIGCEVLARYEDEIGALPPGIFVPLISEGGATWKFTEIIVATTVRELSRLDCPPGFRVSFNFYPKDLEQDQLERIKACAGFRELRQSGFQLVCEILETGIGEMVSSEATIAYLKGIGFRIAIDDFGTGTSNLKQLKDIRPHYLKIDKSFVDDIGERDGSFKRGMVPHIIAIAKEIGTEVVAEGVETKTQAEALSALGAEFVQGFYYARPLPFDEFRALLAGSSDQAPKPPGSERQSRAVLGVNSGQFQTNRILSG